jgi:TonB-dependent receptor
MSQSKVEQISSQVPVVTTPNHARDAEEFDGTERTTAAYAMAEIYAGSKLFLLPGVRYEYTSSDYTGNQVLFAPSGAWLSTTPVRSTTHTGVPLPAFHLKYAMTPDSNLRIALTRTFARPNYYDVVPYEARNDVDNTVSLGNADLHPTMSWNVDVLAEHYFKSVGVVSGGFFYKQLKDYIYIYTYDQPINGTIYHYTQPLNGDAATIRGVEVALQNQLTFLPAPLNGLGLYANYTFSDSTASFPQHNGDSTLPGQSKHIGNLALSYEKRGFQGRVAMTFHGTYVDVVGATNLEDRYYDTANQLDFSASQRIAPKFRVYVNGLNLNDALLRYYQGTKDRVLQEEHYRWWMDFGVKFDF